MNYKILLFTLFLFPTFVCGAYFVDSLLGKDRMISLKNDLDDNQLKQIYLFLVIIINPIIMLIKRVKYCAILKSPVFT